MNVSGICAAAPRDEMETSPKDIRNLRYPSSFDAISKEFGITDWGFIPKKVCEINRTSLTLEGELYKDKKVQKNIRVDLEKNDNSGYKVTLFSEIPESTNTN
jgi:hypothetical protein